MFRDISSTGPRSSIEEFTASNPIFLCVTSYTATSEIPGLTVAGASPDLVRYTPAADAEFLYYGKCRCIDGAPATPDGKPTPALITRTALTIASIPALIVDSGAKIKPAVPAVSFSLDPGEDISKGPAMALPSVQRAFEYGQNIGAQLSRASDLLIVGESIPGGTTTALAVLCALGIDAQFKVSSSMPENPHELKNQIVEKALTRYRMNCGNMLSCFEAVAGVGDPMIPSVAGIADGALRAGSKVMLAGGTQMASVLLFLKSCGTTLSRLCIGTTSYVVNDRSSDLAGLVKEISPQVPVLSCDLHLDESKEPGLRAFSEGFVKEGVGAGGASIAAIMKSGREGRDFLSELERQYCLSIKRS